ncbi:MAG: HAD-IIIA family hydrolase [Proteobacteria bacterium]|nr:HAD-IIIA family hydrolase [Pseudomonadota bacterium]
MALKAIIFDRDGTLNEEGPTEGGYVTRPGDLVLIDGVADVLRDLRGRGIKPFVYTQQSCVGKGLLDEQGLAAIHARMQDLLGKDARIEAFYYCPHVAADRCMCRKPMPGMLFRLMTDHKLRGDEVVVIGDSLRDGQAAHALGLRFAYVRTGKGKVLEQSAEAPDVPFYDTLAEAVKSFL